MSVVPLELCYDPDPAVWLVGPTPPHRPYEEWLPGAVEVTSEGFEAKSEEARSYILAVLERFGTDESMQLSEKMLRWRTITEVPLPFWFGMVPRDEVPPEDVEFFLAAENEPLVEPAMVDDVEARAGASLRRGLAYSTHPDGITVSVRYVLDDGHPDVMVLGYTAADAPGRLIAAFDDMEELLRTVEVKGRLVGAGRE